MAIVKTKTIQANGLLMKKLPRIKIIDDELDQNEKEE